jgi:hypothetical protein
VHQRVRKSIALTKVKCVSTRKEGECSLRACVCVCVCVCVRAWLTPRSALSPGPGFHSRPELSTHCYWHDSDSHQSIVATWHGVAKGTTENHEDVCLLGCCIIDLMIEAASTAETSVSFYQTARFNIQETTIFMLVVEMPHKRRQISAHACACVCVCVLLLY